MGVITTGTGKIALDDRLDGIDPYEQVEWAIYDAKITGDKEEVIFEQKGVKLPKRFSQLAANVICSKFFYGELGTPERECSFETVVRRVSETYGHQAIKQGYMDKKNAERLRKKTAQILLTQMASFNSPVWFNVGTDRYPSRRSNEIRELYIYHDGRVRKVGRGEDHRYPQTSACFIQGVEDNMEDIMDLARKEAILFKHGSGTGTDLSTIRSTYEKLSGGGKPSGPLSFMRVYDQVAAVVKSGGKTRRAAKMQSLKVRHPNIMEFIEAKMKQEDIMRALMEQGYSADDAADNALYQNANFSIRVTDEFMRAVLNNEEWQTTSVVDVDAKTLAALNLPKYNAREILMKIAESTWNCGDPGVQYDTTINRWHTCPNSGRINASNPCSEYMFLDDSSCNLASINLLGFRRPDGSYDIPTFEDVIETKVVDMDLNYDFSCSPSPKIASNSHRFRPLGLGYSNLGALIMASGLSYDSDAARALTGSLTALLLGKVYETSTKLAEELGPFEAYGENKNEMLKVIQMHIDELDKIDVESLSEEHKPICKRAKQVWDNVIRRGKKYGFRNAQGVVLAPTGTISFEMDCDTTGIEPDIALVKTKELAGGGFLRIVNQTVPIALEKLGYKKDQITEIVQYIGGHSDVTKTPYLKEEHYEQVKESNSKRETLKKLGYSQLEEMILYLEGHGTVEGAPYLKDEHLPVFDCAYKAPNGKRCLSWKAHVDMMAAAQPFVSGAISKTVNMPRESTAQDIFDAYICGWQEGLKALAIYREGSKTKQVLKTTGKSEKVVKLISPGPAKRVRLPDTRQAITHRFQIGESAAYMTTGFYPDGKLGEVFVTMAKEGSTAGGFADAFGTAISIALQYGVPPEVFVEKFSGAHFEPHGPVVKGDNRIRFARSPIDYIFRRLGLEHIPGFNQIPSEYENHRGSGPGVIQSPVSQLQLTSSETQLLFPNSTIALDVRPKGVKVAKYCRQCHSDIATFSIGDCIILCDQDYGGCGLRDPAGCGE